MPHKCSLAWLPIFYSSAFLLPAPSHLEGKQAPDTLQRQQRSVDRLPRGWKEHQHPSIPAFLGGCEKTGGCVKAAIIAGSHRPPALPAPSPIHGGQALSCLLLLIYKALLVSSDPAASLRISSTPGEPFINVSLHLVLGLLTLTPSPSMGYGH